MSRPPVRTEEALLRAHERRIKLLERRIATSPSGLPARLGPQGQEVFDWNDALLPGYYWGDIDALNSPFPDRFVGEVFVISGGPLAGRLVQEVRIPTNGAHGSNTWRRVHDGTWKPWKPMGGGGPMRGTSAHRAATHAGYWDMWQDTDGSQLLYVGNKSGGWRRFAGQASSPAQAWSTTQVNGPISLAGRTVDWTIPTVLELNENVLVTLTSGGSGFTFASLNLTERNPTNTMIRCRLMQIGSIATQSFTVAWQIAQVSG